MKTFIRIVGLLALIPMFVSCQNDDLNAPSEEESVKEAYARAFIQTYGTFPSDQSWDASGYGETEDLSRSESGENAQLLSRAWGVEGGSLSSYLTKGNGTNEDDWYVVEQATRDYLDTELKEGKKNTSKTDIYTMTVPNNPFVIVPIYQGKARCQWELWMHVGNVSTGADTKIMERGDGCMQKKNSEDGDWITLTRININDPYPANDDAHNCYYTDPNHHTLNAAAIRGLKYKYDLTSFSGQSMYFYLKIIDDGKATWFSLNLPAFRSSTNGQIVCLTGLSKPSNLPDDYKVQILGCEDINLGNSNCDYDFNDIVFLVYATPDVPTPTYVDEYTTWNNTAGKRYMMEDLGSTGDFDFNDIVVDVIQLEKYKYYKSTDSEGKFTIKNEKVTPSESMQAAYIRHQGGTLPLRLKIGNTYIPSEEGWIEGEMNPDGYVKPEEGNTYTVSGWSASTNNVWLYVNTNKMDNDKARVYVTHFPANGEVPMMLATRIYVDWMTERTSITQDWFNSLSKESGKEVNVPTE